MLRLSSTGAKPTTNGIGMETIINEEPTLLAPTFRVAHIALEDTMFETDAAADRVAALFGALALARQRACVNISGDDISAALTKISAEFSEDQPHLQAAILGPMTTDFPAVVRSLEVLEIKCNGFDESADLGSFAALATGLRELNFQRCGLTSVRGLEGRCEYLRKVDLWRCQHVRCLEGLRNHVHLEEVDISYTAVASVEPLRKSPALTKVNFFNCQRLSSIDALAGHQWLEEVIASHTDISSIEALRTCPALTKVLIYGCREVSSIEALEDHQSLQEVSVAFTAITSVAAFHTCPALKRVVLYGCQQLTSIEPLRDHQWLEELDAAETAITSIEPLRTCPALTTLDLTWCEQLPADLELPDSIEVTR